MQQQAQEVTPEMIREAATLSGLELTEEQADEMAEGVNRNLRGYAELHEYELHNSVAPPLYFSAIVPGTEIDRSERPFRVSSASGLRRPADLEEVAFWPLTGLGELIRTRQVTSLELTEMYLGRLKRYNPKFNNVVTFTDDLAMEEARRADMEIRSGQYRGPLHGLPWGAKDILAVRGYPTTWGSNAFKDQVTDYEATVVRLLREAGAVAPPPPRSATRQFFQLANHACLPAVAVRNGFGDDGLPTGIIFVGKPFSETKVLSLAKAYQDSTGFHRRVPDLEA